MSSLRPPPVTMLDGHLARRLEDGEARRAMTYATALDAVVPDRGCAGQRIGDGVAVHALGARASRAFAFGMHAAVTEAHLDDVEAFYAARKRPAVVSVCPFADVSLLDGLARRGYAVRRFEQVWIRVLDGLERISRPGGVDVRRPTPDETDAWCETVARGHAATDDAPIDANMLALGRATCRTPGATCFYALVDGERVAGAAVMIQDRIASFFGSSTLPRARRRGAHTALLAARLAHAVAEGCDVAVVVTAPGAASQRNVERCGFRLAYTKADLAPFERRPS